MVSANWCCNASFGFGFLGVDLKKVSLDDDDSILLSNACSPVNSDDSFSSNGCEVVLSSRTSISSVSQLLKLLVVLN